jgi:RNA polymerase sigma-70 factor, ECF subfamily
MRSSRDLEREHPKGSEPIARELVQRAAAGDRAAVREVLEFHAEQIRRLLYRLLVPRSRAALDDVQQDVFLRIITALPEYRERGPFAAWVAIITINAARQHLRNARVRSPGSSSGDEGDPADTAIDHAAGTEVRVEAREHLAKVSKAMDMLTPNHRIALSLKIMGHSVKEIATLTSSAVSTTRLRLFYGRRALEKALRVIEASR